MPSPANDVIQVNALLHGYENGVFIASRLSRQENQKALSAITDGICRWALESIRRRTAC